MTFIRSENTNKCVVSANYNVFSQLVTGRNQYVGYFSKVSIIAIAIILAVQIRNKNITSNN